MNPLIFLIGCIGTRAAFAYAAYAVSKEYLRILGYIALIPAIGFTYIYLTGSRKTGLETDGKPIWWNDLRPLHAALYYSFAYSAITGESYSWMFLAADVTIGLAAFINHHNLFHIWARA